MTDRAEIEPLLRELAPQVLAGMLRRAHCDRVGRDYDELSKAVAGFFYTGQPASEMIGQAQELDRLGVDHIIYNVADDYQGAPVQRLGTEVVPALAEL